MIIKITYKGILNDSETYKLSKADEKYSFYETEDSYFKFIYKDKREIHALFVPWDSVRNIEIIREENNNLKKMIYEIGDLNGSK